MIELSATGGEREKLFALGIRLLGVDLERALNRGWFPLLASLAAADSAESSFLHCFVELRTALRVGGGMVGEVRIAEG